MSFHDFADIVIFRFRFRIKESKSMLIKALYPNLLNGFDFLCELIMSSRSLKQLENGHSQRSLKNLKQYNKIFSFPVLKVNII